MARMWRARDFSRYGRRGGAADSTGERENWLAAPPAAGVTTQLPATRLISAPIAIFACPNRGGILLFHHKLSHTGGGGRGSVSVFLPRLRGGSREADGGVRMPSMSHKTLFGPSGRFPRSRGKKEPFLIHTCCARCLAVADRRQDHNSIAAGSSIYCFRAARNSAPTAPSTTR